MLISFATENSGFPSYAKGVSRIKHLHFDFEHWHFSVIEFSMHVTVTLFTPYINDETACAKMQVSDASWKEFHQFDWWFYSLPTDFTLIIIKPTIIYYSYSDRIEAEFVSTVSQKSWLATKTFEVYHWEATENYKCSYLWCTCTSLLIRTR